MFLSRLLEWGGPLAVWMRQVSLAQVEYAVVCIALFKDVENAEYLHSQLVSRNAQFDFAMIDATSVCTMMDHGIWA